MLQSLKTMPSSSTIITEIAGPGPGSRTYKMWKSLQNRTQCIWKHYDKNWCVSHWFQTVFIFVGSGRDPNMGWHACLSPNIIGKYVHVNVFQLFFESCSAVCSQSNRVYCHACVVCWNACQTFEYGQGPQTRDPIECAQHMKMIWLEIWIIIWNLGQAQ